MRLRLFLVLTGWLFLFVAPASPILLETGSKQRVGGYWVKEDAKEITVRIKMPDGKERLEVFDRTKVKILHKVDRNRLEKLTKQNPGAYRDFARELAENKADPEAAELALRLFLIAAYLDPPNLGRNCLLSMSTLATRPADARKYRTMAFLLDSKGDPALLKEDAIKAVPPTAPESKATVKPLVAFQKALKFYRNGDIKAARDYANEKGAGEYFSKTGLKDQKSFLQACQDVVCTKCSKTGLLSCPACNGKGKVTDPQGTGLEPCATCNGKGKQRCASCEGSGLNPYSEDYLKIVLRAEIWAIDQQLLSDLPARKGSAGSWSGSPQQSPVPWLTLETITEYDPRACVFRNGKWEVP